MQHHGGIKPVCLLGRRYFTLQSTIPYFQSWQGAFLSTLLRLVFHLFRSKGTILSEMASLKTNAGIQLQRFGKKRVQGIQE